MHSLLAYSKFLTQCLTVTNFHSGKGFRLTCKFCKKSLECNRTDTNIKPNRENSRKK